MLLFASVQNFIKTAYEYLQSNQHFYKDTNFILFLFIYLFIFQFNRENFGLPNSTKISESMTKYVEIITAVQNKGMMNLFRCILSNFLNVLYNFDTQKKYIHQTKQKQTNKKHKSCASQKL